MATSVRNINAYLAGQPVNVRNILGQLRQVIRKATPGAEEVMSYQMPAYKYYGLLVWFAAHTNHIGFYPRVSAIEAFKKEISAFKWAKGSVQFPLDRPLPLILIRRIVKFRVKENEERAGAKKSIQAKRRKALGK